MASRVHQRWKQILIQLSKDFIEESLKILKLPPAIYMFVTGWASNNKPSNHEIEAFSSPSIDEWILTFGHDLSNCEILRFHGRTQYSLEVVKSGVSYVGFTGVTEELRLVS